MPVDIFQSRRGYFEFCKWWKVNPDEELEPDEFIIKKAPSGTFYAKEVGQENTAGNQAGGVFMFQRTTVTLKSPDDLFGIVQNCIVEYQGERWRVMQVSKQKSRMQSSEYMKDRAVSHYWFLSLRK